MTRLYPQAALSDRLARAVLYVFCAGVLAFLILPILAIIPLSFNAGSFLTYPLAGFSLRWYQHLGGASGWPSAFRNSLIIATAVTALATPLGTLAALGLARLPMKWQPPVIALLLAPLFLPTILIAVATYFWYAPRGLTGSYLGLVLAHTTLATPFVLVTLRAALQGFDTNLLRAGASLGAPPVSVFMKVLLPLLLPAVIAGAIFAFMTSFDEMVIALFLAGLEQRTLPLQMFEGVRDQISPAITAAATLLITTSVLLLSIVEMMRRRRARLSRASFN